MAETLSKSASFWFSYLRQDEWWLPYGKPRVRIAQMHPVHAGHSLRWLERRAASVADGYSRYEQAPDEVTAGRAGDPVAWLRATPLCRALAARESGGQDT